MSCPLEEDASGKFYKKDALRAFIDGVHASSSICTVLPGDISLIARLFDHSERKGAQPGDLVSRAHFGDHTGLGGHERSALGSSSGSAADSALAQRDRDQDQDQDQDDNDQAQEDRDQDQDDDAGDFGGDDTDYA